MSKMTAKIKKSPNKAIKKLEEIAKQMVNIKTILRN